MTPAGRDSDPSQVSPSRSWYRTLYLEGHRKISCEISQFSSWKHSKLGVNQFDDLIREQRKHLANILLIILSNRLPARASVALCLMQLTGKNKAAAKRATKTFNLSRNTAATSWKAMLHVLPSTHKACFATKSVLQVVEILKMCRKKLKFVLLFATKFPKCCAFYYV